MSQHKKMKLSKVGMATLFALFGSQQVYAQQAQATEQDEATIEKIEKRFVQYRSPNRRHFYLQYPR